MADVVSLLILQLWVSVAEMDFTVGFLCDLCIFTDKCSDSVFSLNACVCISYFLHVGQLACAPIHCTVIDVTRQTAGNLYLYSLY